MYLFLNKFYMEIEKVRVHIGDVIRTFEKYAILD